MEYQQLTLIAASAASAACLVTLAWAAWGVWANRRARGALAARQRDLESERVACGQETARREALQRQLDEERARSEKTERSLREALDAAQARSAENHTRMQVVQAELKERERNLAELPKAFKAVSQDLLTESRERLVKDHQERGAVLVKDNQDRLSQMLTPVKTQLDKLRQRADEVHNEQAKDRGSMREQIAQLAKQTDGFRENAEKLANALRQDKKTLGNWGEVQVERLLEMAGLAKNREYRREESFRNDEGRVQRPDFVINLPEGKHLVIDSKVSLNDYVDCVNAEDDERRQAALTAHVQCMRRHIETLAERDYANLPELQVPDFVFMFVPIESAYLAAFDADPRLLDLASQRKIAVVVPNTLLAILHTVHSLWRIDKRNRSALELAEVAKRVHGKLCVFGDRFEQLGRQLETAQSTYDKARTTLSTGRGNLIHTAEGFKALGIKTAKSLPATLVEESTQADRGVADETETAPSAPSEEPPAALAETSARADRSVAGAADETETAPIGELSELPAARLPTQF